MSGAASSPRPSWTAIAVLGHVTRDVVAGGVQGDAPLEAARCATDAVADFLSAGAARSQEG